MAEPEVFPESLQGSVLKSPVLSADNPSSCQGQAGWTTTELEVEALSRLRTQREQALWHSKRERWHKAGSSGPAGMGRPLVRARGK